MTESSEGERAAVSFRSTVAMTLASVGGAHMARGETRDGRDGRQRPAAEREARGRTVVRRGRAREAVKASISEKRGRGRRRSCWWKLD